MFIPVFYPQCLTQDLIHSKGSINICGMKEKEILVGGGNCGLRTEEYS